MIDRILNILRRSERPDEAEDFEQKIAERTAAWHKEQTYAEYGIGRWVKVKDMHPAANVWHRLYRTSDGKVGRFFGYPATGIVEWYFPDDDS